MWHPEPDDAGPQQDGNSGAESSLKTFFLTFGHLRSPL
jgi:hypothetical protein